MSRDSNGPVAVDDTASMSATTVDTDQARLLIRDLLSQQSWSTAEKLDSFLQQWQSLPAATKAAADESLELNQLANAIYKQLLVERALSGIGDGTTARIRQQKLVDFAAQVGIVDSRIAMAD